MTVIEKIAMIIRVTNMATDGALDKAGIVTEETTALEMEEQMRNLR